MPYIGSYPPPRPPPPPLPNNSGPDATLNTEVHKNSVRMKASNSVNASNRKHKNQINHYDKQRRVLMANSTTCQSKYKPIAEPRRAKPKTYRQAPTHWLK